MSEEIMKRTRLKIKFDNTKSEINRKTLNKQMNNCVSLI